MDNAQGMHGGGGFSPSITDESYWSEYRASNEELLDPLNNLGILPVYDPSIVSMGRQIGEGCQGCIYEANLYMPFSFKPIPVVVKKFKVLEGVSQGHFPPDLLFGTSSLSVCIPFGVFLKDKSLCMVMRRYTCDLRAHIDACMKDLREETYDYDGPVAPFLEDDEMFIILKLAMGMKELHDLGISHRDLKAGNILILKRCRNSDSGEYLSELGISDFERSEGIVGTGFHRAPEVLQFLKLETKVLLSEDQWMMADVYSFGMVCYEVLTGKVPFAEHLLCDYDLVLNGGRPELPDRLPERMKDMIRRCWHADPSLRPSWTDILQVLTEPADDDYGAIAVWINGDYMTRVALLESLGFGSTIQPYVLKLEQSSGVGSTIKSNVVKLKQLLIAHRDQLDAYDSNGFASYAYWGEEYIAAAEEYVSKFQVEYLPENTLMCKWPEFVERSKLYALLNHHYTAYTTTLGTQYYFNSETKPLIFDDLEVAAELEFTRQINEISGLMRIIYVSIIEVHGRVKCAEEFDEDSTSWIPSWISKLLFFHAFYRWQLWNDLVVTVMTRRAYCNLPDIRKLLTFSLTDEELDEYCFCLYFGIFAQVETCIYIVALFTCEPIILCVQYGLYKIKGGNNYMYHSSGYRICRLQRAWMNFARHKLLSLALILSPIYFLKHYTWWIGILYWIVWFPGRLRNEHHWRQACLLDYRTGPSGYQYTLESPIFNWLQAPIFNWLRAHIFDWLLPCDAATIEFYLCLVLAFVIDQCCHFFGIPKLL